MAGRPTDYTPKIGDRIEKRGLGFRGEIIDMDGEKPWVSISWDDGREAKIRPSICHVSELSVVRNYG